MIGTPWHPGLNVDFLNVGQGDATYLRHADHDWAALVDGGWGHAIDDHLPWLRAAAPRIDVLVGTHCDGDHLEGLCVLLEDSGSPEIGTALLPPFVHPTGAAVLHAGLGGLAPGRSPFAAHHVARHGAAGAVASLEEIVARAELAPHLEAAAGSLASELEDLGPARPEAFEVRRFGAADDEGGQDDGPPPDLLSGHVSAPELGDGRLEELARRAHAMDAPRCAAAIDALRHLGEQHDLAAVRSRLARVTSAGGADVGGRALATLRAALEVAADVASLSYLERLVMAERSRPASC